MGDTTAELRARIADLLCPGFVLNEYGMCPNHRDDFERIWPVVASLVADRDALRAKVNSLAEEWERLTEVYASARVIGEIHYRDAAQRLRALIVQEDTEEHGDE